MTPERIAHRGWWQKANKPALATLLAELARVTRFIKVLGWYDNEWGYACRTADLAALMVEKGL